MTNINIAFIIFVVAFVAAGLVVTPALIQDADAERRKPKKIKDKADFIIDEPIIELVKDKLKKAKDRG